MNRSELSGAARWEALFAMPRPVVALAPMQDITDFPFWTLMSHYGGPDVYWTEYLRVHPTSRLDRDILRCIDENPTGRPAVAQLIGNDVPSLVRAARELQHHPLSAIDLNLGCPAPVVYRKCAGGGLLREPGRVDSIVGALREAIGSTGVKFTVKTRIGFDDAGKFDELLTIFARHKPDLLTVHARTVKDMYRPVVRYEYVSRAAQAMDCPVLANGDIDSAERAADVVRTSGVRGLMIGRGAIRNPWLFGQIRDAFEGRPVRMPVGRDVLAYVEALYEITSPTAFEERLQVEKMKKYMNFLGVGAGRTAADSELFLHRIRRVSSRRDFFSVCRETLDHGDAMPLRGAPQSPPPAQT